jgi:O-antigen/teichoic acid export membrane protein
MRLGRSALGVLTTNAISLVLSLGNSVLLTRTLGVVGRGEFAVFSASFGILSLVLGFGLDSALRYYVAAERVARERILTSLIFFLLLVGALLAGTAHLNHRLFANELFLPYSKQSATFELVLAGMVVVNIFYSTIAAVFAGARSFRVLNVVTVASAVLSLPVYGVLYWAKEVRLAPIASGEVFLVYLALAVTNALALGGLAYVILGVRPSLRLLDKALLRGMLRYGALAYAASIAQFLNYRIDIWIVQYFSGTAAVGLYSLAGNLAMMLWVLPRSTSTVLLPAMAAGDPGASIQQAARLGRVVLLVSAGVGGVAAFSGRHWIELFYGRDFEGSAGAFAVLLIGCVPFSLCVVQAAALGALNHLRVNLAASSLGFFVTILLDLFLVPRFGIIGAAAASSASYLVTAAVVAKAFSAISSIPLRATVLPQRGDLSYVSDGLKTLLR